MRLDFYLIAHPREKQTTADLFQTKYSCPYQNCEYKNLFERSKEAEILNPDFIIKKLKKFLWNTIFLNLSILHS